MARRVTATIDSLPKQPKQIEVEFGIVLDMEAGAIIAKAGASATMNIKLILERNDIDDKHAIP
jgi:hypothetical protein